MKKLLYIAVCLILLGIGIYFISQGDFLVGLLAFFGAGGRAGIEIKKKADKLREESEAIKVELEEIKKKKKNLNPEDKTDEEEEEYWKNQ